GRGDAGPAPGGARDGRDGLVLAEPRERRQGAAPSRHHDRLGLDRAVRGDGTEARQAAPAHVRDLSARARRIRAHAEALPARDDARQGGGGEPMPTGQLFIAGAWRPAVSGETYQTINPATEEPSATVAKGDERDIDLAVAAARTAFDRGPWPRMTAAERGRIVWKLGDLITQHLDEMARLESLTTGKT